jgi:Uma2 family endonuclease
MSIAGKMMTAEEFEALPADGVRRELIEGQVCVMSPAGYAHGIVALQIGADLVNYVRARKSGKAFGAETGFLIERSPDTVLGADCAFVRQERLKEVRTIRGYCGAHPDLAVEVISPSDTKKEVMEKALRWLKAGVSVVWVFDPDSKQVTVYQGGDVAILSLGQDLTAETLLPGFSVKLSQVFDY